MKKTAPFLIITSLFVIKSFGQWSPPSSKTDFITTTHTSATQNFGLNLENSGSNYRYLIHNNLSGTNQQAFYFGHANNVKNIFGISTSEDSGTSWNPRFMINQNGNVGVGGNPHSVEKFSVYGSIRSYDNGDFVFINASANDSYSEVRWGNNPSDRLRFYYDYWDGNTDDLEVMSLLPNGRVGIGTTSPDAKLAVNGDIHAKKVKVDLTGWPDYVFEKEYDLPTLEEVEVHIAEQGHLQDIPSAEEVEGNGINLGEMNSKLLQKIEELMLYTIQQQKEIEELKKQNIQLQDDIQVLKQK